jgi:hypothetical protein
MDRKKFQGLLRTEFFPGLRESGFQGSGTTLRRITEPIIHVVNIQGSSSAAGFYVNLGTHLSFLPTEGGSVCVPKAIKESQCSFRTRVDPLPSLSRDGSWPYGRDERQARLVIGELWFAWRNQAEPYFSSMASFPEDFSLLVEETVSTSPHPSHALTIARIGLKVGMLHEANSIARAALDSVPEWASSLKACIEEFLSELKQ